MNTEPRIYTDEELDLGLKYSIEDEKALIIRKEKHKLELMKKFDLTYVGEASDQRISIETENFSASLYSWDDSMNIRMKCELDVKDIKTFEEFEAARKIVIQEKQRIMTAVYWLKFRLFKMD